MQTAMSISDVLAQARPGDPQTVASLMPVVYAELKALATSYLRKDGSHSLQPTALVHEAFIKMVGPDREWSGKDHFMAIAAIAMRQVLVDHARARNALKRGGGVRPACVSLCDPAGKERESVEFEIEELDELLTLFSRSSSRAAKVAEMHLFGGMTMEQIARVLGLSLITTKRDWQLARAWIAGKMQERSGG
ncbi:MAG: RNA polymerase subunit sigma-70 [Planctomycetes bacterium]|nr:RNA polymerase subunit sigma-70 [Planctomycetota bacterium]